VSFARLTDDRIGKIGSKKLVPCLELFKEHCAELLAPWVGIGEVLYRDIEEDHSRSGQTFRLTGLPPGTKTLERLREVFLKTYPDLPVYSSCFDTCGGGGGGAAEAAME
jgi:hypothetical protein